MEDVFSDGLVRALADTADPDQALLGLVRLFEAVHREQSTSERRGQDRPDLSPGALHALVRGPGQARDRLLAVLGASPALGDHLVRHPDHWVALTEPEPRLPEDLYDDLVGAVGADPRDPRPVATADPDRGVAGATDALRVAYRRRLLALAGRDLASTSPGRRRRPGQPGARRPRRRRARGRAGDRTRQGARPRSRLPDRGDRDGQVRRTRAQLRQRRRRRLRRRAGRGRRRGRRARHRHPARDRAGRRVPGEHRRGHAVAGRRGAAARGQGRAARAHPGEPPRVLRPVGEHLGVPGAAQGPLRGR